MLNARNFHVATDRTNSCASCQETTETAGIELKKCAKCKTTRYCSKDCQKADWKVHKRICASLASSHQNDDGPATHGGTPRAQPSSSSSSQHNPGFHTINAALGLSNNDYLHKLPQKEAMNQLIDSFRMRVEDEYKFTGNNIGLYNGEDPMFEFKRFLDLAESRVGILPGWWSKEKRSECEELSVDGRNWSDINSAVEKSDIQDYYGDAQMPMKLRILAEKIYGKGFM